MRKYPKGLASSVNPHKLSLTIKGVVKFISALLVASLPFLNVQQDEIYNLVNSLDAFMAGLDTLIVSALALWGILETIVGAVRKLVMALGLIKPPEYY